MFITLRSSGSQNGEGGMEQVARRNAGPGGANNRVRLARRPTCVACRTKKLRCTGSSHNCDRCRARLIECVFPTSNGQDNHRTHSSQRSSSSRLPWQEAGDASPQQGDSSHDSASCDEVNGPNLGSSKLSQQPAVTAPRAPIVVDPVDGDSFDLDLVEGLGMDMEELGRDGAPIEVRSGMSSINMSSINRRSSDTHQPNKSPQDATPLSQAQAWALSGVPPPPNPNPTTPAPCSCLSDLVRVVQQLDDDEFHITTMSLDQVLRLQKWLVFQCCRPLDCPKCSDLSSIHTVRLIICDRLTEMFECIHLRIKRAGAILTGQSSDSSTQSTTSSLSPDSHSAPSHHSRHPVSQPPAAMVGSGPLPAQLFCSSSGRPANTAACNPLMFSDDFRNQYSEEEQVHMISVLLRLHIRNFQNLLLRVEHMSEAAVSQARRSKVKSMMVRLSKATMDIEGALRVVFQCLSTG
ncbi:hypothetical protein VTI74DRAFT_8578 [Chaetomium olivicolor]